MRGIVISDRKYSDAIVFLLRLKLNCKDFI